MRTLPWLALATVAVASSAAHAQIDARLMRYPAVSASQIAFAYAGDIWVVAKTGGSAQRLSTPKGEETFPRFSPDGRELAFSGNYDGHTDIYVMPAGGGVPTRVTHHPMANRLVDWSPDGKSLLFASGMESGRDRFNKLFLVAKGGGLPKALPMPYGEFGALSPDGKLLAYQPITREFRTWKRYRGGMASEIWIYDLAQRTAVRLPDGDGANNSLPMWHAGRLYFLSDRDRNKRSNIWSYDLATQAFKQETFFTEFDVHFPSIGPDDLVLEAGGKLHRLDLASGALSEVKITVATDLANLKPHQVNASKLIRNASPSPQGKRAVLEARGDLFSVPADKGYIINLTHSSGVAERYPAISPDGKQVAYFSDRSGEYELYLRALDGTGQERQVTHLGPGFRYHIQWAPDGKKVVFPDQAGRINLCDLATGKVQVMDQSPDQMTEDPLDGFRGSWSADSRWFAYNLKEEATHSVVKLYDTRDGKATRVTSPYFSAGDVAFDPEGNYLYLTTNQEFSPTYSDMDDTWVYAGSTRLAALPLRRDVASPLAARNDADPAKDDKKAEKKDDKKDDKKVEGPKPVAIDLDGLEGRMVLLPPAPGYYGGLAAVKGKLIYQRAAKVVLDGPNTAPLYYFDFEAREEKTILAEADSAELAGDGQQILVKQKEVYAFIDLKADQKIDKKLPTAELMLNLDPKAEWRQIFDDAWRLERDLFYDPGLHGVDWKAMKARYGKLIDDCVSREDVNFVIGELIAELNSSHSYRGGGDLEVPARVGTGLLGADYALENGRFRIKQILRGAPWDAAARGPLAQPGLNVKEGDYLLAVNHTPLDPTQDPWAGFQGLAGKTVLLTVNDQPSFEGAREILVETIPSEATLRYQNWVEAKRRYVDQASGGTIGYVYVPDTGINGQTELVRQFHGQFGKAGLIIDERWNSGGQIPERFIELLQRKTLNHWAVRDGKDWSWPVVAHDGPMAMLINGWSGSGGDAFPFYFKQAGLGKLIGRRTWGGLIGISGAPPFIDGGSVTVPDFGIYSKDGKWIIEGHGVEPDIEVMDDPGLLVQGKDPQLDRALQEVQDSLKANPLKVPARPAYPDRSH
jgi:tricorn protease